MSRVFCRAAEVGKALDALNGCPDRAKSTLRGLRTARIEKAANSVNVRDRLGREQYHPIRLGRGGGNSFSVPQLSTQAFTSPRGTAWRVRRNSVRRLRSSSRSGLSMSTTEFEQRDGLGEDRPNFLTSLCCELAKASVRVGVEIDRAADDVHIGKASGWLGESPRTTWAWRLRRLAHPTTTSTARACPPPPRPAGARGFLRERNRKIACDSGLAPNAAIIKAGMRRAAGTGVVPVIHRGWREGAGPSGSAPTTSSSGLTGGPVSSHANIGLRSSQFGFCVSISAIFHARFECFKRFSR